MKQLSTFLVTLGLFSFACLVLLMPPLIVWYIVSLFSLASVIIFLIVQVRPVETGENHKRKWVIIGGISGIIGPVLSFSPLFDHIWLALFPFSIVLLDSEFLPSIISFLLFICVIILNIGLFALLGLFLGTIVRGISRVVKGES